MRDAVTMEETRDRQNYYITHFLFTVQNVFQHNEMYKIFPLRLNVTIHKFCRIN